METLSITLSVAYLIINVYYQLVSKMYKQTQFIYGKYNTLVHVLFFMVGVLWLATVHYYLEWHIYNSITIVLSLIGGISSFKYLKQFKTQ